MVISPETINNSIDHNDVGPWGADSKPLIHSSCENKIKPEKSFRFTPKSFFKTKPYFFPKQKKEDSRQTYYSRTKEKTEPK